MSSSQPSIPYLFVDSSSEENVSTWEKYINENPTIYENCFIRRITHVKDLNSAVLHEYLQVIVEDKSSGFCTRLIIERLKKQDQVTIGRWKPFDHYQENRSPEDCYHHPLDLAATSVISSSGSLEVLPLPLCTQFFPEDTVSVQAFAKLLGKARQESHEFLFTVYNCYWFSECVYGGARALQLKPKDHIWKYAWLKGKLWFVSGAMKRAAERFLELQGHVPISAPGDEPMVPTDEYYIQSLDKVIRLAEEDASKSPTEVSSMTEEEIEEAKEKYHESIGGFVMDARSSDEWESERDMGKQLAYATGWQPLGANLEEQSIFGSMIPIEKPTEEENKALEEAIFSFIGRFYEYYMES